MERSWEGKRDDENGRGRRGSEAGDRVNSDVCVGFAPGTRLQRERAY